MTPDETRVLRQIGTAARARRTELRLTLDDVAQEAGTSRSALARIEAGKSPNVSCVSLMGLARALSMPLTDLLGTEGEPFPVSPKEREVIETLRRLYPEA